MAARHCRGTIWSLCQLFEDTNIAGTNAERLVTWTFDDEAIAVDFSLTTRERIEPFFIPGSAFRRFALPQEVDR